ncbi:MAG TPA: hypothetical protein PKN56_15840 [Leptospiraceae bacterium]|nr:hypothetical protein [Leptospiraceae bacterium]HMY65503.1 hypothetical protein [Leptospiraceae bacterium]HNH10014.1 hypothetical protein [Leptospiraceae bacterium]HNI96715.1 hypothetical protein [Leptospiraceae bacterium]HNN05037.1 hypothetical protein [Leptospiraceae bacterium]
MKKFIQKILNLFRKKREEIPAETEDLIGPLSFDEELKSLRKKFQDFLLTSRVDSGTVVKRRNYSLSKNGPTLFRLEGTESSGKNFSIAVVTGSQLQSTEEKTGGLIVVTEAQLNKAIQKEYATLEGFLSNFKDLNLNDSSYQETKKNGWKEIASWKTFYLEQIFLKLRPDEIAILLVVLDDTFRSTFMKCSSRRLKEIIRNELFFLNQSVNSADLNPNSSNAELGDYDKVCSRFFSVKREVEKKMEKDAEENTQRR